MKRYLLLLFVALVPYVRGAISDKRLCADAECQVPISEGITAIRYSSIEPDVLSFVLGDQVTIYSKHAGSNLDLWGAEIRGKRGYIPRRLVKEMRVFVRDPGFVVDTEKLVPEPKPEETQLPDEINQAKPEELPTGDSKVEPTLVDPIKEEQQKQPVTPTEEVFDDGEDDVTDENDENDESNDPNEPDDEEEEPNQETLIDLNAVPVPTVDELAAVLHSPAGSSSQDIEIPTIVNKETPVAVGDDSANVSQFNEMPVVSGFSVDEVESSLNETAPQPVESEINRVPESATIKEDPIDLLNPLNDVPTVESSQTDESTVKQSPDPVEEVKEDSKDESKQEEEVKSDEGYLNTALNWLGLSDTEEPLIEDKQENSDKETVVDASNLMLEIASLDPNKDKPADEPVVTVEEKQEEKVVEVPVDAVCSKESCNKVVVPEDGFCSKESCDDVPASFVDELAQEKPVEEVTEAPKIDQVVEDHHHYPGDGHDHHHHDDHSGHGHGHSHGHGHAHTHLPGYIPGFGRHYKPPEQIQQEIQKKQSNQDVPDTTQEPPYPPANEQVVPENRVPEVATEASDSGSPVQVDLGLSLENSNTVPNSYEYQPVPNALPEPVHQTIPMADPLAVPEPVPESIQESVPEPIQESVPEPIQEPIIEPVPEPIQEQVPEPIQEQIQEPVPDLPRETVPEPPSEPLPTQQPLEVPAQQPLVQEVNDLPEYIPVDQIFAEMEKQREREQQANESSGLFDSLFDGFEGSYTLHVTSIAAVSVVLFLTLYYAIDNGKYEKLLRAKIAQLDAELHEMQAMKDDTGASDELAKKHEAEEADLLAQIESMSAEKASAERRLLELEKERENLKEEVDALTETAAEATRLFEESMANQSKYDEWFREMQLQCDQQKLTIETLNANLGAKTAENETLVQQLDEVQSETEKFKVKIKSLQSDMETLKTANKNYQQKASADGAELLKLKQEKESLLGEKRALSNQLNRQSSELNEWREKVDHLKRALKTKDEDLAKTIELMKSSGGADGHAVLQLSSLVKVETELEEANLTIDKLNEEIKNLKESIHNVETDKDELNAKLIESKSTADAAVKEKKEAETRLEVLSNYFKEKENQWQKELGSLEAKGALNEENVTESFKRIVETEQNLALYKSQVETLKKEIEEQERSFKLRLAAEEKRAHENWVQSRQLERRLEESKQEASQLRQRLTQVEKEKEAAILSAKENGVASMANGDVDVVKAKRLANGDDLPLLEPVLASSAHPPPPPLPLDPDFDPLYPPPPPPAYLPPVPFEMLPIPPPPPLTDHHRPPPLGMLAGGSFDVDYHHRREMEREPVGRRFGSPPRRFPSPPRSERSVRSDRSDRMDRYDDHFRSISPPYGRGRPRSVGRSRDPSPDRPESFSPLPSPLYPSTIHSPNEDWDDPGRSYRPPMMRTSSLRAPPAGPKTSSPLVEIENHVRHRPI